MRYYKYNTLEESRRVAIVFDTPRVIAGSGNDSSCKFGGITMWGDKEKNLVFFCFLPYCIPHYVDHGNWKQIDRGEAMRLLLSYVE